MIRRVHVNYDQRSPYGIVPDAKQIYMVLSDPSSIKLIAAAYTGLKTNTSSVAINLTKRQYYLRLRRLIKLGLVEKRQRYEYKTTSFGSLIYEGQVRTLEKILNNYWQLHAIDLLKGKVEFPLQHKQSIIENLLGGSQLNSITNDTYLRGFKVIKDFQSLIIEVMRVLDNAENEIYFASRYHDPHVSDLVFRKFNDGVKLHILDGTPSEISIRNRINAILRTAPNRDLYNTIQNMIRSPRFELFRLETLPTSFLVVDGKQCVYETVNYANPQEFTIAAANFDDEYLAERYVKYFELLRKNASTPKIVQTARS